jgi:NitT/TauT family transport system permease protein
MSGPDTVIASPRLEQAEAAIDRPLPAWQRLAAQSWARRGLLLVILALVWQVYADWAANPLMFPSFTTTARAFGDALVRGTLLAKAWTSVKVLLLGYGIGATAALVLAGLAASSRWGEDLLATLVAMFNPLPAIALLPLALLWFGLGTPSLLFVLVHAVMWPLALNAQAGFAAVAETLRMAGRNYGLSGWRYILLILIPAAFPAILSGLKVGWAFAWRTLIAAELVFGVASGSGGLGWFIFENKNRLETDYVFAGLGTVILIGLAVEGLVFRAIEARTVRKWGMSR